MDKTQDILERCEVNRSLFGFTRKELETALKSATREIHRYALELEIAKMKKHEKRVKKAKKARKPSKPNKKDPIYAMLRILTGQSEFGD